ncbi:MAG: hypothetical protein OXF56_26365 [Rhodobacteraceae bacterium]|nr:hypothetical protein [Paracoccaceae bacterium]
MLHARLQHRRPTYFEAFLLDGTQWEGKEDNRRLLVDGGVFANNRAMIVHSEVLSSGSGIDEILLCFIGTGKNDRVIPCEEAKDWGPLGWSGFAGAC